jgi:glutathione S-transferase
MISLHGTPVSNYYNTVLAALHHKGIPVVEVHRGAAEDPGIHANSPMGKIPYIRDGDFALSETTAILEYLEETFPENPLYPRDVPERARARQAIKFVELYVDAPARSLFPGVFWGQGNHPVVVEAARPMMERGLAALDVVAVCSPWLMGGALTCADYYAYFSLAVARRVAVSQYGWDFLDARPALAATFARLETLPLMAPILRQRDEAMARYLAEKVATARQLAGNTGEAG